MLALTVNRICFPSTFSPHKGSKQGWALQFLLCKANASCCISLFFFFFLAQSISHVINKIFEKARYILPQPMQINMKIYY